MLNMESTLFEAAPGLRFAFLPEAPAYKLIGASKDFCHFIGKQKNSLSGLSIFEAFGNHPVNQESNNRQAIRDSIDHILRYKEEHHFKILSYTLAGNGANTGNTYWHLTYTPVFNERAEMASIICTIEAPGERATHEDTTESAKTLASLIQLNDYFQSVINVFDTPLQVLEPVIEDGVLVDFRYKMTNNAYAVYAGVKPAGLEKKRVGEVFPGYFRTSSFTNVVETYKTGVKNTWEIHYNQDGLDIYNEMTATKMGDDVVVHFTDFTKLKNLQLELLQKIEQLQQSNQNLEEFAYAASHDMKEPIRKIHFFGDRLRESLKERITAEEASFFDRMESATTRMRTLIEDLLQYSQVSIKPRVRDDLNLNQLISVVLEDLDLEIDEKRAEITFDTLPTVRGHERQLQQAFQNLLANSLKYCKPDVRPRIRISHKKVLGRDTHLDLAMSDHHRAFHCLSISDNGIGFAQNNAERIFNVFTRLHSNHEYRGTGVGLSIVRKVIENHGGHIWATSAPGKGSTFKVILPVA